MCHVPETLGTYIYAILIKDWVGSNNISIAYFITEHMLEYFFTKYLHGVLSVKFRELIMGWKHINTPHMGPPQTN